MTVFEAFPEGIISGVWELGQVQRATVRGKVFSSPSPMNVIADEGTSANTERSPNADYDTSDTLIYAKPEELPTLNTAELASSYIWHNKETGEYYDIRQASLGKNQVGGTIEHVEFLLRPTEVLEDE